VLEQIDWFTPNETEAAFDGAENGHHSGSENPSDVAEMILCKGCKGVVLKMGSNGSYLRGWTDAGKVGSRKRAIRCCSGRSFCDSTRRATFHADDGRSGFIYERLLSHRFLIPEDNSKCASAHCPR
jgi:hypothetical protein